MAPTEQRGAAALETPPSLVRNLYKALGERGFEVTFAVPNTTLSVSGRDLDPEQIELLAEVVAAHGARMIVDQRGRFEIWIDPEGPK